MTSLLRHSSHQIRAASDPTTSSTCPTSLLVLFKEIVILRNHEDAILTNHHQTTMDVTPSVVTPTAPSSRQTPDVDVASQTRGLFSTGFTRNHVFVLLFLLLAFAVMPIDVPVACYVNVTIENNTPYWFRVLGKACDLSEIISHGIGVMIIMLGIFVLDPAHRRAIPRLMAGSFLSGFLAVICKSLIIRTRPRFFVPEYFANNVSESFGSWLPLLTDDTTNNVLRSFPSAHTATAVGLAIGMSWLYPHARWFFFLITLLAGCQRLIVEAHFLSDVFVGCAIGMAFSLLCVGPGHLGRLFRWIEQAEFKRPRPT